MKKKEMREEDELTDPLNASVISLIEETNSNLVNNVEYEERISEYLKESKNPMKNVK